MFEEVCAVIMAEVDGVYRRIRRNREWREWSRVEPTGDWRLSELISLLKHSPFIGGANKPPFVAHQINCCFCYFILHENVSTLADGELCLYISLDLYIIHYK